MRATIVFLLLLSFLAFAGGSAIAQDEPSSSIITVKNSQKNSGGTTIQITKDQKDFDLTCNESMPSCVSLKKGNYRMVELPKNRGMYDCANVKIYPESSTGTEEKDEIGAYCLSAR